MPRALKAAPPLSSRKIAAYLPVNSAGEPIEQDADEWEMPAGPTPSNAVTLPDGDDAPVQSASDRVSTMLQDAGADATAKITIYRVPKDGRKLVFLDEMPPEDFERGGLKGMAINWGAGDYEIRHYGSTGESGVFGLRNRVRVSLEAARAAAFNPSQGVQAPSELSALLAQMATQQADMLRALTDRPVVDPMAQMTQMLTMMKLMKEATGSGDASPKSNLAEMLAVVKELKGVSTLFEGGGEDSSMMGMLKDLLPAIVAGAAAQKAAQQPVMQPLPQLPAPVAMQPPQPAAQMPQQTEGEDVGPLEMIKLRGNLAILVAYAQAGAPVDDSANHVLDTLPDEMIDVMEQDDWWANVSMFAPQLVPHQAYITQVRDRVFQMLDEPEGELDGQQDEPPPAAVQQAPAVAANSPGTPRARAAKPAKSAGPADTPAT